MIRRDRTLDIIRIVACLMVVLMHSPLPSENAVGPFLCALSYFTAPCIGLFFMVSGALLLPVRTGYVAFIRKRFTKIVIPTLFWSVVYIILNIYFSESEINILQCLTSIPFSAQGNGVLWFMYTLAGLYLIAPILSAWLEKASQRELQIVLLIWCVTLCYPLLEFYVTINQSTGGLLYYFTGYAGYFILGYYLRRFPESISIVLSSCVALSGAILLLVLKYTGIPFDFFRLFWYESIFIAALAVATWKIIYTMDKTLCFNNIWGGCLASLSNSTFGVYLLHILIMRHWLWNQRWIIEISNYPVQSLFVAFLTLVISFFICWLISFIPYSQWIIGYHNKQ